MNRGTHLRVCLLSSDFFFFLLDNTTQTDCFRRCGLGPATSQLRDFPFLQNGNTKTRSLQGPLKDETEYESPCHTEDTQCDVSVLVVVRRKLGSDQDVLRGFYPGALGVMKGF